MSDKQMNDIKQSRDKQVDLIELIGGSWPPAPKPIQRPDYGTQPRNKRKMQPKTTTIQHNTNRIKSLNLLTHLDNKRYSLRRKNQESLCNASRSSVKVDILQGIRSEMVHDNIQTGILIDVGSENRSSCHYDTPASPSSMSLPDNTDYNSDLGIGSMVQVNQYSNNSKFDYGVIRWIGCADDHLYAGVELEEEQEDLTDGTFDGERLFTCPHGRALFVPLELCEKDSRFQDTPSRTTQSLVTEQPPAYGKDSQVVTGCIPPLDGLSDLEGLCGKYRGIQGHNNSCYLDATLFSMFMFTSVFDSLLYRPAEAQDSPHYVEVQRVLREEIVNPLRQNMYVGADRVMKLRKLLEKLSSISGLTSEEKDPEEFLNSLVAQILRAEPFLKLNSGQETYHYQLFVEKDDRLTLPTVQQLFEQSFQTSNIKLREVPSCLIIQMPRFGKSYKMYPRILPSQVLDVTDVIEDIPRQCTVCGKLAIFECKDCFGQCGVGLESIMFCQPCLQTVHSHAKRTSHKPHTINVPSDVLVLARDCVVPRVYMELFAVLCIETSHYVAFVKAGTGCDAPWCFFDSMADRKGEQNGYNIPEIVLVEDINTWLSEEGVKSLLESSPNDKMLPEHARRLLSDAYMCMYHSSDVSMYR